MGEITAALVKELRDKTGAGMMHCKEALTEASGDIEAAVDWLRTKGLSAAAKKAGRVAAEGLVGVAVGGTTGAAVEVNAETDFVARNDSFQDFTRTVAEIALNTGGDVDAVAAAAYPGGDGTVQDQLTTLIATVGENMTLRRSAALHVDAGVVAAYVHNSAAPGLGKIGVLVALQSDADTGALEVLGKQLAMHVAASSPLAVSRDDIDAADLERERAILADQARASGKPEEIVDKMVDGRMRKYFEEACLLEQTFVIDGESKVETVLEQASQDLGSGVSVIGFVRMVLGEGVEKKEENFAAEVAAAVES